MKKFLGLAALVFSLTSCCCDRCDPCSDPCPPRPRCCEPRPCSPKPPCCAPNYDAEPRYFDNGNNY